MRFAVGEMFVEELLQLRQPGARQTHHPLTVVNGEHSIEVSHTEDDRWSGPIGIFGIYPSSSDQMWNRSTGESSVPSLRQHDAIGVDNGLDAIDNLGETAGCNHKCGGSMSQSCSGAVRTQRRGWGRLAVQDIVLSANGPKSTTELNVVVMILLRGRHGTVTRGRRWFQSPHRGAVIVFAASARHSRRKAMAMVHFVARKLPASRRKAHGQRQGSDGRGSAGRRKGARGRRRRRRWRSGWCGGSCCRGGGRGRTAAGGAP